MCECCLRKKADDRKYDLYVHTSRLCDHSEFADVPAEQGGPKVRKKHSVWSGGKMRKTDIMAIIVLFVVDPIVEVGWDGVDGF